MYSISATAISSGTPLHAGCTYPMQVAVSSPAALWDWLDELAVPRFPAAGECRAVRVRDASSPDPPASILDKENVRLRGLREATSRVTSVVVAEVMREELNSLRHRLLINQGSHAGAFGPTWSTLAACSVKSSGGPWTAEAILITDPEHAIPVEVNRNGLRTIAVGDGDRDLNCLACHTSPPIRTSRRATSWSRPASAACSRGLSGRHRDQGRPGCSRRCAAFRPACTTLTRDREVMLIWTDDPPRCGRGRTATGADAHGSKSAPRP